MSGNYKPRIDGGEADSGIWRRVVLVPWAVTISKEKRDMGLGAKLKAEGSGILNRWLAALAVWCEHGLQLPDQVAKATEEFRVESDPLGRFFSECCRRNAGDRVSATTLYELFVAWARFSGERGKHDWTQTGFGNAMRDRGLEKVKTDGLMHYLNITATRT
jgi:putative DNA primase/helicase